MYSTPRQSSFAFYFLVALRKHEKIDFNWVHQAFAFFLFFLSIRGVRDLGFYIGPDGRYFELRNAIAQAINYHMFSRCGDDAVYGWSERQSLQFWEKDEMDLTTQECAAARWAAELAADIYPMKAGFAQAVHETKYFPTGHPLPTSY